MINIVLGENERGHSSFKINDVLDCSCFERSHPFGSPKIVQSSMFQKVSQSFTAAPLKWGKASRQDQIDRKSVV